MAMDREQLCQSLTTWMQTFHIDGPRGTPDELTDGVAMSQALHQIAPNFFSSEWMTKIKADSNDNWRLKVSNLKKILKSILDYYSEVLGQQIQDFHMPDIKAIGEHHDTVELGRLLQLILGCAVNCDDKQHYIQRIMAMEEVVQHAVMEAIQELMTKEAPASSSDGNSELSEQLKRRMEELNNVMEQKEEIAQRCHELDLQVTTLQEEKSSLMSEVDRLNDRINQADSLEDPSTPVGRRYQQLQHQVETLQEELYRTDAVKEDLRIKGDVQEKEILELQQKNEDLVKLAEEGQQLKDEVDVLRHTSDKVSKYEQTIDTYKKKLEELSDLKGQVKMLEEKNTSYMQTNLELEEEIRKFQGHKSQLDVYKRQVQELQMRCADETKRADKAEFETCRAREKMQALQRERERLVEERDSLRDMNDELKCSQTHQDSVFKEGEDFTTSPGFEMMALPPEVKERIIRLQHENKMLKLQKSATDDEQGQLLQSMLEDANSRNNELQSVNRIQNQRILELEARVEDLQESQQAAPPAGEESSSSAAAEMKKRLGEYAERCQSLDAELQKKRGALEEAEAKAATDASRINEIKEQMSRKDDEMRVIEEKYKKYLNKARDVIKSLDQRHNPSLSGDVQALRNQLQEKERLIEHLEKDHEKTKVTKEQEEKLIVSAWYNLGMLVNRKSAEDRLAHSGSGQSFLARQRQAHTRRTQSLISPHAAAGSR